MKRLGLRESRRELRFGTSGGSLSSIIPSMSSPSFSATQQTLASVQDSFCFRVLKR